MNQDIRSIECFEIKQRQTILIGQYVQLMQANVEKIEQQDVVISKQYKTIKNQTKWLKASATAIGLLIIKIIVK